MSRKVKEVFPISGKRNKKNMQKALSLPVNPIKPNEKHLYYLYFID